MQPQAADQAFSPYALVGVRIAEYKMLEVLGEGGMGAVFKGVHEALGQLVAVKMIRPEIAADAEMRGRFVREAQALARLHHPGIVQLYRFLDVQEGAFLVMELVEGMSLAKLLSVGGALGPLVAAEYFVQVLAAMHYAHSLSVIHRDMKPSNVLVTPSGQAKILDFGTAKIVGAASQLTRAGTAVGTLVYMSPEQIRGKPLDHRSDIYSLGVMLYEMLTLRIPFEPVKGQKDIHLMKRIVEDPPPPPSSRGKPVPRLLEEIVLRALAKDAGARQQTAEALLQELKAFIAEEKQRSEPRAPEPAPAPAPVAPPPPAPAPAGARAAAVPAGPAPAAANPAAAAGVPAGTVRPPPAPATAGKGAATGGRSFFGGVVDALGALFRSRGPRDAGAGGAGAATAATGPAAGAAGAAGAAQSAPAARSPAAVPDGAHGSGEYTPPSVNLGSTMAFGKPLLPPPPAPAAPRSATPPPPQVGGWLYVIAGPDQGKVIVLSTGAVTIGRDPLSILPLRDPSVSTSHAQIGFDGTRFVVQDLRSSNGTYVNDVSVTYAPLAHGDRIRIGGTVLAISLAGAT